MCCVCLQSHVRAEDGAKVTIIALPRKEYSPVLQQEISFVSHLLTKVKQAGAGQNEVAGLSQEMARMKVEDCEYVVVEPADVVLEVSTAVAVM